MPDEHVLEIDELRRRYEVLRDKKSQAEALLNNANQELERLRLEAQKQYGTSDLKELQAKLQLMEEENLSRRREYQKLLEKIESDLRAVEDRE